MKWLAAKAVALGADIVTGVGVTDLSSDLGGVETKELGRIDGDHFVVAAGPETFNILERAARHMSQLEEARAKAWLALANTVESSYVYVEARRDVPSVRATFKHGPIFVVQNPKGRSGFLSAHAVTQQPRDPSELTGIIPVSTEQVGTKLEIARDWFEPDALDLSGKIAAYGAVKAEMRRSGATKEEIVSGVARRQLPGSVRLDNVICSLPGQWSQAGWVGLNNVLNLLGRNSAQALIRTLQEPVYLPFVDPIIFDPGRPRYAKPALTNSDGTQGLSTAHMGLPL